METILRYNMMIPWISFWVCFIGNGQGDIILSIISRSNKKSCLLDGEVSAIVSCEITPNTSTPVLWKKNTDSLSTCDNTADNCLPAVNGRYNFTSNFTQSQFYINIPSVALGSDEGVYLCEVGGLDESITLTVCKVPTTAMFTESGSGTVNLTSTTDCVYPETDVTIAWFYVLVSAPNNEKELILTPTKRSIRSDCQNGAKKVTSTIQHTDATENTMEVYFLVKVSHSASANLVEEAFYDKSYFITDVEVNHGNSDPPGNIGAVLGPVVVISVLVLIVLSLLLYKNKKRIGCTVTPIQSNFYREEGETVRGCTVTPIQSNFYREEGETVRGISGMHQENKHTHQDIQPTDKINRLQNIIAIKKYNKDRRSLKL